MCITNAPLCRGAAPSARWRLTWNASPFHDGGVLRMLRALWSRIVAFVDDSLPMPPDQREARDWTPETDEAISARRRLRMKLDKFERRGRGDFR